MRPNRVLVQRQEQQRGFLSCNCDWKELHQNSESGQRVATIISNATEDKFDISFTVPRQNKCTQGSNIPRVTSLTYETDVN